MALCRKLASDATGPALGCKKRLVGKLRTPAVQGSGVAPTSLGSQSQGCSVLCQELALHDFSIPDATAIATELVEIVAVATGSDSRGSKIALRSLLRFLRQCRTSEERVAAGYKAADVARCIWTRHLSASLPSEVRNSVELSVSAGAPAGVAVPVVPPMLEDSRKVCFVVHGVLNVEECNAVVARCDAAGWEQATLEYGMSSGDKAGEAITDFGLRDSCRCVIYDENLAKHVWARLQHQIPSDVFLPLMAARLNSCFRCLRYSVGQAGFAKHMDGPSVHHGEVSKLTVQIYLNESFDGGATRLCHIDDAEDVQKGVDIVPRTGMALVFDQTILHKGCPVRSGVKHTARTEIMYSGRSSVLGAHCD